MIVKNEEKNIERALSWGKGIVSEQIVVDTGSTDRTVDLAKTFGAKVYHFDWIDDFAAAKNFAISKAKYEWIAFLDADEYLTEEDGKKLLPLLNKIQHYQYDGVLTGWINLEDDGTVLSMDAQMRIFRNLPKLRYHGRIHEHLIMEGRSVHAWDAIKELPIFHTGYGASGIKEKQESKRNYKLIQRELADHPDDYKMWGYLGNEYEAFQDWDQAEISYQKAIDEMPKEARGVYDVTTSQVYFRLIELLLARPPIKEEEVLEYYRQASEGWPEEGDYDYLLGSHYVSHGNYQKGQSYLLQALNKLEQYGSSLKSGLLSASISQVYEMMAACCYHNGNPQECVHISTTLLKENPYQENTITILISAFRDDMEKAGKGRNGALEVAAFLGKSFYNLRDFKDKMWLMKAAEKANYPELVQVIRSLFTPEEQQYAKAELGNGIQENLQKGEKRFLSESMEPIADPEPGIQPEGKLRIALFYSGVESFNFFTDQLANELQRKGHQTFIFDLLDPPEENPHSLKNFRQFIARKVDAAICFDGFGTREDWLMEIWDRHQAYVADILMDPPFRFHPMLEHHPKKYHMFCCDWEHVEYVKKYFRPMAPYVTFMPHVGVVPDPDVPIIPYSQRKYDILFCGTYYRPQDKLLETKSLFPGDDEMYGIYESIYKNLIADSDLTIEQAVLTTLDQLFLEVPEDSLKVMLNRSVHLDWAIRMYQRERVVTALAQAGLELYLLGRGWENHPVSGLPNVHRIDDRIPYGDTLSYMANAKINLNVMPWFKAGTHDRIFNTLLQHSLPLTDPSLWITETFQDGEDIALFDLKHLEQLPDIARNLLTDSAKAERMIEKGYEKVRANFTWVHCTRWLLDEIKSQM